MRGSRDTPYEQRIPLYGGFPENDLIEQPAIDLFGKLGWKTVNLFGEFTTVRVRKVARAAALAPERTKTGDGLNIAITPAMRAVLDTCPSPQDKLPLLSVCQLEPDRSLEDSANKLH
jgi:hypothetical protein